MFKVSPFAAKPIEFTNPMVRVKQRKEFCAKISTGLDPADFNAKRQIIELLEIRCKIAFENGQKVVHLKCLIDPKEQQQRLPIQISLLSSIHTAQPIELAAKFVIQAMKDALKVKS